jgi:hydrogenase/urease accessory protein HupE
MAGGDMTGGLARRGIASLAFFAVVEPARAHLVSSGMGPTYDAILHFLTSPEDLVTTIGLALLAGQNGASQGRRAAFVAPTAWLFGGLAGWNLVMAGTVPYVSTFWLLLIGGLVLAKVRLPLPAMTLLCAVFGFCHGLLNGAGWGPSWPVLVGLLSLTAAVFIAVCLASATVVQLKPFWAPSRSAGRRELDGRERHAHAWLVDARNWVK